jgi:peptidoglycan/xylan/chitin deacetylase (PgdA/CDA1 family)
VAHCAARSALGERNAVALTFDDGPDPEHTPKILDQLRRLDCRATFFLVGERVRRFPGLAVRIVEEGHAVGSHSQSHIDPWTVSWRTLAREYRDGRRTLEAATGGGPIRLFRPPKGYLDGAGAAAIMLCRLRPWLWTIDSHDWMPRVGREEILHAIGPLRGGEIILLHDAIERPLEPAALDRSATVAALPEIVARARAAGLGLSLLH